MADRALKVSAAGDYPALEEAIAEMDRASIRVIERLENLAEQGSANPR